MKKESLSSLLRNISDFFVNTRFLCNFAVLLTGSVARNDYVIDDSGDINSDIDILIVIKNKNNIKLMDKDVGKLIFYLKEKYKCDISMIYTLYSKALSRRDSLFLQSPKIIFDSINLQKQYYKCTNPKINSNQRLCDFLQGIFYYQAKYNANNSHRSALKINKLILCAWHTLKNDLQLDDYTLNDSVLINTLNSGTLDKYGVLSSNFAKLELIVNKTIKLCPSSSYFLQNKDLPSDVLYENVRNIVFMENQGLDFYTSTQSNKIHNKEQ